MTLVIGLLAGFLVGYLTGRWVVDDLGGINKSRHSKRQQRLDKLVKEFKKKDQLTNDDAQDLLGVSDKTARNYFNELERDGIIEQHGDTGRGVFYTLKR